MVYLPLLYVVFCTAQFRSPGELAYSTKMPLPSW
jgi:hypothetical protein